MKWFPAIAHLSKISPLYVSQSSVCRLLCLLLSIHRSVWLYMSFRVLGRVSDSICLFVCLVVCPSISVCLWFIVLTLSYWSHEKNVKSYGCYFTFRASGIRRIVLLMFRISVPVYLVFIWYVNETHQLREWLLNRNALFYHLYVLNSLLLKPRSKIIRELLPESEYCWLNITTQSLPDAAEY